MEYLAQMITQPWMVIVFVSIILLVALRPLYQAIFSISTVNYDVCEAIKVLVQLGKNKQDEFYNQFKAVNSQILRIPGLRHTWREFVDSMYFEDANIPDLHKKAYVSHRPSHYFNRDSVLGTRLNLSQFFAYPNYLIGIGLTFTFIGLAAALHVAQAGLASGAGQQALKDLLAVAALKFISSIVGISSSLVISAIQRVRIRTFQQKLNAFCDLLEECTKYKSAEELLHDSFNEQRRHTVIFNDMAKNIADGINDAISNHLSASVANGLAPLTQDIRSLAQNFAEGSESALSKMVEAFLNELRKSSADEMQGLMNRVGMLKDSLNQLAADMESAGKNFGAGAKVSAHHLDEMCKNFVTSFTPVQLGITQFGQSLHALEAIADNIEQAGNIIHSATDDHKKSAGEFGKIMADMSSLTQSFGNVEKAALHLKAAGETIATAAGEFKHSAAGIKHSENTIDQKMKMLESLAQGVADVIEILERTSVQLGNAATSLDSLDGQFSKSVDSLGDAIKQLPVASDRQKKNGRYFFGLRPRWWKQ